MTEGPLMSSSWPDAPLLYVLDADDETPIPLSMDEVLLWADWMEVPGHRVLKSDRFTYRAPQPPAWPISVIVSTIFLGVDAHPFGESPSPPRLWESMVFGGPLDRTQRRYASKAEALVGHAELCVEVEAALIDAAGAPAMSDTRCLVYRPDHNGECLLCDESADAHSPEAITRGAQAMTTCYLSFCDPSRPAGQQFLGGCLVDVTPEEIHATAREVAERFPHASARAPLVAAAVRKARLLGCNPGGEVLCVEVAQANPVLPRVPRGVLLDRATLEAFDDAPPEP